MKNLPDDIRSYVLNHKAFKEAQEVLYYSRNQDVETFRNFCDYMLDKILEHAKAGDAKVSTHSVCPLYGEFFRAHRDWYDKFFQTLREEGFHVHTYESSSNYFFLDVYLK